MSRLAVAGRPFLFLIDFEQKNPIVCPVDKAKVLSFYFNLKGVTNTPKKKGATAHPSTECHPC